MRPTNSDILAQIADIQSALDKHTLEETAIWTELQSKLTAVILLIDNIQVNGRKGLQEAFQDIYTAISGIKTAEKGRLLNKTIGEIISISWVSKFLLMGFGYLLLGVVLHLMGFDTISIILKLFSK